MVNFLSISEKLIFRIASKFNRSFYTQKQRYGVQYRTTIKNISEQYTEGWLVIPVPGDSFQQRLIVKPRFQPASGFFGTEEMYGNSYAGLKFKLNPGEEIDWKQNFQIEVVPDSGTVMQNWEKNYDVFKSADAHLQFDLPEVEIIAEEIKVQSDKQSLLKNINQYVITRLQYGNPIQGLYTAGDALKLEKVDCGGFGSLMAAIARKCGLSSKLVFGFWAGYMKNEMHAWLKVSVDDRWIPADPSMEFLRAEGKSRKSGELGFLGSDRIVFSEGSDYKIDLAGEQCVVDVLQHPLVFPQILRSRIDIKTVVDAKKI